MESLKPNIIRTYSKRGCKEFTVMDKRIMPLFISYIPKHAFHFSLFTFHLKILVIFSFSLFTFHSAQGQALQPYIEEAVSNNPSISSAELRYGIAKEKITEVNSLPNTTIGISYFGSMPETRLGAQQGRFSVSQMLPWFGTITARENYSSSMAESEYVEVAIAKRKLALSVAQSYYALYAIKARQEVLAQNIQLLQTYEQLALTSVEVGKASVVDVLRLQIRQNELRQQQKVLQEEYVAERSAFNILRNQNQTLAVEVVAELELPAEDIDYPDDAILANPEVLKYDKLYESVTQSEVLNQKERAPSLGFGVDYIPVAERTDMNPMDNGKDILMPMVTFSIPIFNQGYKSISKQNELRQQEIQSQKEQRLNTLKTLLANAISERNQARILFETQAQNLKQAKDAEEILIKNYETGTIDFNDLLDIQELQLKFEMSQIEALKNYYKQCSIINYLIS